MIECMSHHKAHAEPIASTPEQPAVRVLTCAGCGAPLPLGAGDTITCPYCSAPTPVPDDYRRLRDLHTRDAADHAQAEALFSKLDSPPWYFTQVLARMFDWSMVAYVLTFMVPVLICAMMLSTIVLEDVVKKFHLPPTWNNDVNQNILMGLAMWIFVFVPRAIGVYASRRTRARALLVNLFRARPPLTAGGPALCRRCGAPLAVVPDAVLAHCNYCGADSAVRVHTAELQVAETDEAKTHQTLTRAAEVQLEDHTAPRREMIRELWRYTYKLGVLFGLWTVITGGTQKEDEFGMGGDISGWSLLALLGLVTAIIVFFIQAAASGPDEDQKARIESNPVPKWVAALGPVVAWAVFFKFLGYFIDRTG